MTNGFEEPKLEYVGEAGRWLKGPFPTLEDERKSLHSFFSDFGSYISQNYSCEGLEEYITDKATYGISWLQSCGDKGFEDNRLLSVLEWNAADVPAFFDQHLRGFASRFMMGLFTTSLLNREVYQDSRSFHEKFKQVFPFIHPKIGEGHSFELDHFLNAASPNHDLYYSSKSIVSAVYRWLYNQGAENGAALVDRLHLRIQGDWGDSDWWRQIFVRLPEQKGKSK